MDPLYLSNFFLLILYLGGCLAQEWNDYCPAGSCSGRNLRCLAGMCRCIPGYKPNTVGKRTECDPEKNYNEKCDTTYFNCKDIFTCYTDDTTPPTCRCKSLGETWDGVACTNEIAYQNPCTATTVCKRSQRLICSSSGFCDCDIPNGWFWSTERLTCVQFPVYDERCTDTQKCPGTSDWNLECHPVLEKCVCLSAGSYVRIPGDKCAPRSKFDEQCDPFPECDKELNLECVNKKCSCTDDNVEVEGKGCDVPGKLEDKCPLPQCDPAGNLRCVDNACACNANKVAHRDRICGDPANLGEDCGPPICRSDLNLICDTVSKKCVCRPPLVLHPDNSCKPKPKFDEHCGPPECETGKDWELECVKGKCACTSGNVQWPGLRCGPMGKWGEPCDKVRICDPSGNMDCNTNKCDCLQGNVKSGNVCVLAALLNQKCDPPSCKTDSNLNCDLKTKQCSCTSGNFPHPGDICGPKAKWNQDCDLPDCETGDDWNLQCTSKKCACTGTNVQWPGLRCGPIGMLGDSCNPLPMCDSSGNMICDKDTGKCACVGDNVEHPGSVCGPAGTHRQRCGPPKCKDNFNLECQNGFCECDGRWMDPELPSGRCNKRPLSTHGLPCELSEDCVPGLHLTCHPYQRSCSCEQYYEVDPAAKTGCRRKLSEYGEFCKVDDDCVLGHFMVCDPVSNSCTCKDSYDQDNGETPCLFNPFNGRTYGDPCEDKPVRRCVAAHNLECNNRGVCVCLPLHIPNNATEDDPGFNVTTCKPGDGTQGRGEKCKTGSPAITDKCDSLKDLDCEVGNQLCTCAPGFVPTDDPKNPCDGGKQKYGSSCDPPEVIIPPRSIDPRTKLPFPGPTSPPPPKFACDVALKLVCRNGKCECADELASGRFRLDKKTGKCLTMGGYACKEDVECLSGKCLTRKEAAANQNGGRTSHDHDEKICNGPPQTGSGGMLCKSPPSTFPLMILIGQLVNRARFHFENDSS